MGSDSFGRDIPTEIHNYVATVKKAILLSAPLRDFFVGQQAIWDKTYKDATSREDWDNKKLGDLMFDALHSLFMPQFEELERLYEKVEKSDLPVLPFKELQNQNDFLKEFLNRVHPEIIDVFEKDNGVPNIFYNSRTCVGWAKGRRFSFRAKRKADVFAKLYSHMNEPLIRKDLLRIAGFDSAKDIEGYFVNELVRDLRYGTGLNSNELVLNDSLTLLGNKQESPPKHP